MIEAELQAVLNIFTYCSFQDALKKVAGAMETMHTCGRGLLSR
jgi:hypothetical protein